MKPLPRVLVAAVIGLFAVVAGADEWDVALERARRLCAQMTLEEKAGELTVYDYRCFGSNSWERYVRAVDRNEIGALMRVKSAALTRRLQEYKLAHSRLRIPLIVHEDVTHGLRTVLPVQIGMACSWDEEAIERAEAVAARESAAAGIQVTYSPQADVSNDPRWGRSVGVLGEDPCLAARLTSARVRGYQGRHLSDLSDGRHVIACVKHYIGYTSLQAAKDYRHLDFSRRELLETHLPPFKAAIDAGALGMMNAYTAFEGQPCNFSRYLLTDLLRGELGFRGQVVTDWTTFQFSIDEGAAEDLEDAAMRGLDAGVDMDMISDAFLLLPKLVRDGKVSERAVDVAVIRSLAMKYVTGLFDDPFRFCDVKREKEELGSEANRRTVLELARESIVLLKNAENVLPLDPSSRIGLCGTWADDARAHGGGYMADIAYDMPETDQDETESGVVTLLQGMRKRWGERLLHETFDYRGYARAEAHPPEADVIVLTLGEPTNFTGERIGRATLRLPETEMENLRFLKRSGKKVVSVIYAGRPFLMDEIVALSDAVLLAWYPGTMGGEALAEILSGETNPSGKLAQHIPLHLGQIPLSYREKRTFIPCAYMDVPATPLYPFGFGLGYSVFSCSQPTVEKSEFAADETVRVAVDIRNTGSIAGREVVQLYVRDESASVLPRERELRDFASVALAPGESRRIVFTLGREAFSLYDKDLKRVVEPGAFTVFVGGDSTTANAVRFTLSGKAVRR